MLKTLKNDILSALNTKFNEINTNLVNNTNRINTVFEKLGIK